MHNKKTQLKRDDFNYTNCIITNFT